jgi:hypothetical protein
MDINLRKGILMDQFLCPICQSNMAPGRAAVRKNLPARLGWPFPSDRLFFKADGQDQKSATIVREGRSYVAYRCENCGALLIPQNR